MCKKDDRSPDQKSRFFASKGVGLSLNVWPTMFITEYMLVVRFIIS